MLNSQESVSFTRSYSIKDANGEKPLVVISGRINPGQMVFIALMVSDKEAVQTNPDEVAAAFNSYLEDIREKARENGLPV